jgi:hypothetical protein
MKVKTMNRDLIQSVSEMLERHWDVYQIAAKMNLSSDFIQVVIDIINGVL